MPQPFNRIISNPYLHLDHNALSDKPEMALLVTRIFAVWATIEQELAFLLVRVLGADATPALAIFSKLNTQGLKMVALEAAAEAALPADQYEMFLAVISMTESAKTPRNHLAHWLYGRCKERPDLLALFDPKGNREREFRVESYHTGKSIGEIEWEEAWDLRQFDPSKFLAYSKTDLERAEQELIDANTALTALSLYLNPKRILVAFKIFYPSHKKTPEEVRAEALLELEAIRSYREALSRIRAGRKKIPPAPAESPQPTSGDQ